MLSLSEHDFQRLYTYIKKNYGIDLSKKKAADRKPPFQYLVFQGL